MHNFYITPTLIDSFLYWQEAGQPADKFEEIINKINKVKTPQTEKAKRGVAFETCINLTLSGESTDKTNGFYFEKDLINEVISKLKNYTGIQVWIERIVDFQFGKFKVGGFADYTTDPKIIDLKTTDHYKLGKYENYSQHKAFGLIDPSKKRFDYYCTDFENLYVEPYFNKPKYHDEFINNVEKFWGFCKENVELIIDKKIWGNG